MEINKTIYEFINEVDSTLLVPGGGCVASLLGALGAALGRMYAHVSVTKNAYLNLDERIKEEFEVRFKELSIIRSEFEQMIDVDKKAYEDLVKAYKLPKNTQDEITFRKEIIYQNTINVTLSPLKMMEQAVKALELIELMLPYGNKNALSDGLVGVICLHSTLNGAYLNVKINLIGLNATDTQIFAFKAQELLAKGELIYNRIKSTNF